MCRYIWDQRPTLRFKLTPTKVHYRLVREGGRARCVPFPPGTRGFFYFRHSLRGHAAAGEIRFRVLRGENAPLPVSEAFALGSDLISQNRITPWRVHVLNVFRSYPAIRAQLLVEGLVSEVQAGQIDAILASGVNPGRLRIILGNIADPFIWDLRNYRPANPGPGGRFFSVAEHLPCNTSRSCPQLDWNTLW